MHVMLGDRADAAADPGFVHAFVQPASGQGEPGFPALGNTQVRSNFQHPTDVEYHRADRHDLNASLRRARCPAAHAGAFPKGKVNSAGSSGWLLRWLLKSWRPDEFLLREPSTQHRVSQPEVLSVRKVVVYELLSLDGVAENPDSFITAWDDVMDANLAAVIAAQDAVILGHRSYGEWAQFWPGSKIQPFATFINGVAKFVATSAPLEPEWANTTVIDGGLAEFVRDLKARPGGDIGFHASISVAQALLAADVVDELRLVIAPRIAGSGRRLLDGLPSIQLESIRSVTSPSGHLLADYHVLRAPPLFGKPSSRTPPGERPALRPGPHITTRAPR